MVRVSNDARIAAWLLGSLLLLLFPFFSWLKISSGERVTVPGTPMDRTNAALAEEWLFLWQVRGAVPRGASFTVRAADRHREMTLFMMAIGFYPYARPVPASYHGEEIPREEQERADYLLLFRCEVPPEPGFRLIRSFAEGCVFKRTEAVP